MKKITSGINPQKTNGFYGVLKASPTMRIFMFLSVLLSTLPVMAMNLFPRAGEEMLAIFSPTPDATDPAAMARSLGLDVVRYDAEKHHLFVKDHTGSSDRALYAMGARFVINARYAVNCEPVSTKQVSVS